MPRGLSPRISRSAETTISRPTLFLHTRIPTLHTYRHLLREASYLPQVCQTYFRDHIRSRFRLHHHDPPRSPDTKLRLRRARHDLRYLWAANHGLRDNMLRLLLLAYGRIGKRRRTLMHDFGAKQLADDSASLGAQIQSDVERQNGQKRRQAPDWLDDWDVPKLHALAVSQARQDFWSPRAEIKGNRLKPEEAIPKENSWGRPLPARLARSKLRKWYKHLIVRLMPPVPRAEWDKLRLLATGAADRSLWALPQRRPRGKTADETEQEDDADGNNKNKSWDWRAYATTPVRAVERGSSRSQKARTGEEGEAPYGLGQPIGVRNYDRQRMWQRLYTKVWEMTPTMTEVERQDAQGGEGSEKRSWRIEWGHATKDVPTAAPKQLAFFQGGPVAAPKRSKRSIRG